MQAPVSPDSLRAVLDSVFTQPAYAWLETPAPLLWLRRAWRWLTEALDTFQADNPGLFKWFVVLLILLLALIMVHAGWVLLKTARATEDEAPRGPGEVAAPPRTAAWYRAEAERLGGVGHYREALAAAFHALVLDLDGRGILRYHPSKTPREYLHDGTLATEDRSRLAALVQGLYGYRFGQRPCGPEEYRAWVDAASARWHAAPI